MSKKAFFKKLLVAGLCAVTATATVGMTACKKDKEEENKKSEQVREYTVTWNLDGGEWGSTQGAATVADGAKITKPSDPSKSGYTFGGWVKEDGTAFDFDAAISANVTVKAKWTENTTVTPPPEEPTPKIIEPTLKESDDPVPVVDQDGKIEVNYEFKPDELDITKYGDGYINGIFTLAPNTEVRGKTISGVYEGTTKVADTAFEKSVKLGDNTSALKINISTPGKLTLYVWNGSSSTTGTQTIKLTKPDNTTEEINYTANGNNSTVQRIVRDVTGAGEYTVTRKNGTSDIFYASFSAKVKDTKIEKIEVANGGTVDYYVGQEFSIEGLAVNAIHEETGRIAPILTGRLRIDYTEFDSTKAGTYEIKVRYVKSNRIRTATYNVNVYSFEGLNLGTDKIVKAAKNSAAGNGVYENHALKQFYFIGDGLSTDGLSVVLNGKNGEKEKNFLLKSTQYTVGTLDTATAGKKSVSVSVQTGGVTKSKDFTVYVGAKDAALSSAASVTLNVDKTLADESVGVKTGEAYGFKTIQQALDFLNGSGIPAAAAKTINVAAGDYWERLEITVPNLTIVGAGRDTTKIEYDSLVGATDIAGFPHVTDSTATLNVRDGATNFTIRNITVSNYFNSQARFNEYYGNETNSGERALAALIQADKVTIDNCALLGYQDTIELFTGRQIIKNSLISGTTDFIFGTNNTTYFYNCEIKSIVAKNTGYVTAFKGNNKGTSTDKITYGAIFDHCNFTCEANVANGKTALGRTWGADAAVMIMNSTLGAHISKDSGTTAGSRYVGMNNNTPADAQFKESNNTGGGAIAASQTGVTVLSTADAAVYADLSVIFAKNNGALTYSDVWNVTIE